MLHFLALQNTYQQLEIALFKDGSCIAHTLIDKLVASSLVIPAIDNLLVQHELTIADLTFIAINQGPGPFTTLRVVITTANGISFASGVPLVGIDGLAALVQEHTSAQHPHTVALLNAFGKEVYYASSIEPYMHSYGNINQVLEKIAGSTQEQIQFVGNAVALYRTEIVNRFGAQAFMPTPLPMVCSIEQVARLGLSYWRQQKYLYKQIQPLYLKQFTPTP